LINSLADYVSKLVNTELNFGDSSFLINDFQTFELKLPKRNIVLTTATPIIIRIPENKYDNYGITKNKRMTRFLYWRQDIKFKWRYINNYWKGAKDKAGIRTPKHS